MPRSIAAWNEKQSISSQTFTTIGQWRTPQNNFRQSCETSCNIEGKIFEAGDQQELQVGSLKYLSLDDHLNQFSSLLRWMELVSGLSVDKVASLLSFLGPQGPLAHKDKDHFR